MSKKRGDIMDQYDFFSPIEIRFESLTKAESILEEMTDRRFIVLASQGTVQRIGSNFIDNLLKHENYVHISQVLSNPSVEYLCSVLNSLEGKGPFARIITIGGGSCIDLAKGISALYGLKSDQPIKYEDVVQAIYNKAFFKHYGPADIIAVPTTSGTGSEVTKWATIWDLQNQKKLSIDHPGCFPKMALMVPELTAYMPERLTLSTGLDALSHAMEAYWSKKRNPLSQVLALDAIKRIHRNLPIVLQHGDDLNTREQMSVASLTAGLAFSMTRTTACHSISYPLTMRYDIEHGFAAAITLAEIMQINREAVPEIEKISEIFGGYDGFLMWMEQMTRDIQPLKLSAFGVGQNDIVDIVERTFTQGRMDNNPVEISKERIKSLLERVY